MKSDQDFSGILQHIKHFLPSQNPLKDFVHHNTLHAFQHDNFHEGLQLAARTFGFQVYLSLEDYRKAYLSGRISEQTLNRCIIEAKGERGLSEWRHKLTQHPYDESHRQKIGGLRRFWKEYYKANPDKHVHTILFRVIGNFLDQGIGIHLFPFRHLPFLDALKALESNSYSSLFKTGRARKLLLEEDHLLTKLLQIVVGDDSLVEHYLFDQQFAHPGWSGMVSVVEDHPALLLDTRKISLHDFICFELLLEIDALDHKFGTIWKPLALSVPKDFDRKVFSELQYEELFEVYKIWQEAYEWSYYDKVLKGLQIVPEAPEKESASFQAVFCIDDRECSIRRHIEQADPNCETLSTAGFFNIPFYFQPEEGKFYTKVCPVPLKAGHLVKESNSIKRHETEAHFSKRTHGFLTGLITAPTIGFWSAFQLGWSILFPRPTAAMVSSFKHMDKEGSLSIDHTGVFENELKVGFSIDEMADRIEGLLKGIGLVEQFAPIVYFIGHGASSTNNTHYAGYDCGACSGRAGSANARVAAYMANKAEVRAALQSRGIIIPETTQFLGGLHDTTRDEADFFDETILSPANKALHKQYRLAFNEALEANAVERSRRFLYVDSKEHRKKVHQRVKQRSLSLFEPRPEWNHASNALCIIGRRASNKHLFLDRRAFLNSYDYELDKDGNILLGILNAVAPVCGGINLEYYFSKMDNYRLGAGSKLPHNVMGLIGVANGLEGDLRTGLPLQMVNIHDPVRLLVVIEHFPELVLEILQRNKSTSEWFQNAWIHLAVVHAKSKAVYVFKNGDFELFQPETESIQSLTDFSSEVLSSVDCLPVFQII
jgi:uncharacterized protein